MPQFFDCLSKAGNDQLQTNLCTSDPEDRVANLFGQLAPVVRASGRDVASREPATSGRRSHFPGKYLTMPSWATVATTSPPG